MRTTYTTETDGGQPFPLTFDAGVRENIEFCKNNLGKF